jgi:hypothetical protein
MKENKPVCKPTLSQLRGPSEITGSHQADSGTSAEFVGLSGPGEITGSHPADSGNAAEFVGFSTSNFSSPLFSVQATLSGLRACLEAYAVAAERPQ